MQGQKADIISQLEKVIFPLQGLRTIKQNPDLQPGLGVINQSFPNEIFPLGAIHELIFYNKEAEAASNGFLTAMLSLLMNKNGVVVWIGSSCMIYPAALKTLGVDPSRIIFIKTKTEKETLWVMEESLKCAALTAAIADIKDLNFATSRRLQLAVEQSMVTGFILRNSPQQLTTTTSVTRWKIFPAHSDPAVKLPGLNFPSWNIELIKCRNGKPGKWTAYWNHGTFLFVNEEMEIMTVDQRKTG